MTSKIKMKTSKPTFLLKTRQDWYSENEPDDLQLCNTEEVVNILGQFLVSIEKDKLFYKTKLPYEIYNISPLNKNDLDAIEFLIYEKYNENHTSTLEERILFYEKLLKIKNEEQDLLDKCKFAPELYNRDILDLEIDKLNLIIEELKDSLSYKNSNKTEVPF